MKYSEVLGSSTHPGRSFHQDTLTGHCLTEVTAVSLISVRSQVSHIDQKTPQKPYKLELLKEAATNTESEAEGRYRGGERAERGKAGRQKERPAWDEFRLQV